MTDYDMLHFEKQAYKKGYQYIAGVDEAGRGPLAGPVVAASVILKKDAKFKYVNDSKKLSEKQRQHALKEIKEQAISISIGISSVEEIDRINIYRATKQAMISAIEHHKIKPDYILIDAVPLDIFTPNEPIIKGDQKSMSIAAASIIAKTTRDAYMIEMDKLFPLYGFKDHKGYGTEKHIKAIHMYGITPIHRKTFKPIKDML